MGSYGAFPSEDGEEYGGFEVFHSSEYGHDQEGYSTGWYWWACFPGCHPDSEPFGPYASEEEARSAAKGGE